MLTGKQIIIYNADFDVRILGQSVTASGAASVVLGRGAVCAMRQYAAYVGAWDDWHGDYRYQKLPGAAHNAIGDCQAVLLLIHEMAGDSGIPF